MPTKEITGAIDFNVEERTVEVNGLKLWVSQGLWVNAVLHFNNADVVKAEYYTDGERRQLKNLVKRQ